jgi:hypothetical protein
MGLSNAMFEGVRVIELAQFIRPRPALGYHAGAMNIAFGMAAALFNRERTGQGSLVEISLLSSAMWTLSADVTLSQALNETDLLRVANEGRYARPDVARHPPRSAPACVALRRLTRVNHRHTRPRARDWQRRPTVAGHSR